MNSLFSEFFAYDSRFWRTFNPLLIKPGKVAKEYILGKREKYVNPFQLYLQVSILFFLILSISNKIDIAKNSIKDIATASKNNGDSQKTSLKNKIAESKQT